jgi:hypothetical protein
MKHVIGIALLATLSGCTSAWDVYPTPRAVTITENTPAVVYTPIAPQPKAPLHVATSKRIALHATVFLGQMADAFSTNQEIRNGAVELNPLLKQIVHHPFYSFSLKTLVVAWNIYEGEKAYRAGNPKWWEGETIAAAVGWGAFGWNERQILIHNRNESRKVGVTP